MATKSYLTPEDLELAKFKLQPPAHRPDGEESKHSEFHSSEFSTWLGERLHARLSAHPDWAASEPIAIGSWARSELSPKSDIDLLFTGDEAAVSRVVTFFSKQGLKLRYRMPENMEDWTVGVLPFDVLALFQAKPLTNGAEDKWCLQIQKLQSRGTLFRRSLIQTMMRERRDRGTRYDSIANFLEPNLKYGPGGLRDLEQSLVAYNLFRSKFKMLDQSDVSHALEVLHYYKNLFLLVRQKLNLADGGGDVLAAPEQRPLSEWLGFENNKDFMREIQKGLSRVSFYADWMIEIATRSRAHVELLNKIPLRKPLQFFTAFENDSSILTQFRVRLKSDAVFSRFARQASENGGIGPHSATAPRTNSKASAESVAFGKKLNQFLMPSGDEGRLVALFRSRLIDHVVPEFRKIVGYVQHDQYHRFSVDAHILQALRELRRLKKNPKLAGKLAPHFKSLSDQEWLILAYACLYHDIAKGREGHHAEEGRKIALYDLKRFGQSKNLISGVTWVVEEHLILSNAAFRENSRSPLTWQKLLDHGVKGRRLSLLLAFTIVDIRATNPDAWTPWKERLMNELTEQLERPETTSFLLLKKQIEKSTSQTVRACAKSWPEALDPFLIHAVPLKYLVDDLARLLAGGESQVSLQPKVVRADGEQTWIRFHSYVDQTGLFLSYVSALARHGLSIRHASVTTDAKFGVYDWFEVKTAKEPALIEKWLSKSDSLSLSDDKVASLPKAKFDSVDFVSTSDDEWVISFRGRDQSGALKSAVQALFRRGLQIKWAKVHTWGRQIDDVFGVRALTHDGPRELTNEASSAEAREGQSTLTELISSQKTSQRGFTRDEKNEVLLKIRAEMA